ncbi:folate receptor alpha-like [Argiope bruennichi]|uniref:Folate receptor alpha like protein n=1 Tax=Argiope bruennichi TaxID=94029 RepID=A0A8T0FRR0_ARGBR|nr:folate receptor alpha-like [Argiope bruennichi]KAF8792359.1 Folate receptor alpha like protein [Argiope bruennichi]
MAFLYHIIIAAIFVLIRESFCQLSHNKDELLNWCLKSKNHKYKPGPEDSLHEQCLPWKDHSCCTTDVSVDLHEKNMYNFTLDHCYALTRRNISSECRKYFKQNDCFYECEPHIGLWVVETKRKIASERFYKVPLCASDCDAWFKACRDDFTCAYNWARDFKFSKGHNTCLEGAKCTTFRNVYSTAKEFCENVWDQSWLYTPDTEPCMHIQFDASAGNPNRAVAEHYINLRLNGGQSCASYISQWVFLLGLLSVLSWNRNSLQ